MQERGARKEEEGREKERGRDKEVDRVEHERCKRKGAQEVRLIILDLA